MPRKKEVFKAMRETTRQKIEAAALSLFARKGLSVKVGEIAKMACISQGLLYSHYGSKKALIGELIGQATGSSGRIIKEIAGSDDTAVEKIKRITGMMCGMFAGTDPRSVETRVNYAKSANRKGDTLAGTGDASAGIDFFMLTVQAGMNGFRIPKASRYSDECPNPTESLARIIAQGQTEKSIAKGNPFQMSVVYWAAIQGLCCYAAAGWPVSPEPKILNKFLLKEEYL